jgi:hypothetical protein
MDRNSENVFGESDIAADFFHELLFDGAPRTALPYLMLLSLGAPDPRIEHVSCHLIT